MKSIEFELNGFVVNVSTEGEVTLFTNNKEEQKQKKKVKDFLEGKRYNTTSLLLENEDIAKDLFKIFIEMKMGKLRSVYSHPSGLESGTLSSIRRNGCSTLFTTHENLQYDDGGRGYADRNKYNIIKINRVKFLH